MNAQTPCPHSDLLQALLDETLPDEQQPDVQKHVDSCDVCQQTLEHLEAEDGQLEELADHLRQPRCSRRSTDRDIWN